MITVLFPLEIRGTPANVHLTWLPPPKSKQTKNHKTTKATSSQTKRDQMQSARSVVLIPASCDEDCYKKRKHAVIYSHRKKLRMEQEVQKSQYVVANTIYI